MKFISVWCWHLIAMISLVAIFISLLFESTTGYISAFALGMIFVISEIMSYKRRQELNELSEPNGTDDE